MKKFLQTIAAVLALAMVITSLPVMPATEAEATTGDSGPVSFDVSSGGPYPYTDRAVVPIIIVQPQQYSSIAERMPSNKEVSEALGSEAYQTMFYQSLSKKELEYDKTQKEHVYAGIVSQAQSAREETMYTIPTLAVGTNEKKSGKNSKTSSDTGSKFLAFQSVAASLWTTSLQPGKSWYNGLRIGYMKDTSSAKLSEEKMAYLSGDDYLNNIVYSGIKKGYAGASQSDTSVTKPSFYTEKDSGEAYRKITGLDKYNGVYVEDLIKNKIFVFDGNTKSYVFNKNIDAAALIDKIVLDNKDKFTAGTKVANKAETSKQVWTFITNFWPEGSHAYDSAIGTRFDGYIMNGMWKASINGDFRKDVKGKQSSDYVKDMDGNDVLMETYIGEIVGIRKSHDGAGNLALEIEDFKVNEWAENQGYLAVVSQYLCNPLFGKTDDPDTVVQYAGLEKLLYEVASGKVEYKNLKSKDKTRIDKYINYFRGKEVPNDATEQETIAYAFARYSENVALYDLYYLDLMLQLYAIAKANNPRSTSSGSADSAAAWRAACVDYINVLTGNTDENYNLEPNSSANGDAPYKVLDPHNHGIAFMVGAYTYGLAPNEKEMHAYLVSANDLVLAENNMVNAGGAKSATSTTTVNQIVDNLAGLVDLDAARSSYDKKQGADAFTITKNYCGYALKSTDNDNTPVLYEHPTLIRVKNTDILNAVLGGQTDYKSIWSKIKDMIFGSSSTGTLKADEARKAIESLQDLAASYKTYSARFENALNASAGSDAITVNDYTKSGSKSWFGYIAGRGMYPVLYKISDGKVVAKTSLSQGRADNGAGFLTVLGQYRTSRGDFYKAATTAYDPTKESTSYGQIGAIFASPLMPYRPPMYNTPEPENNIPSLYASIDIISDMTQSQGNAPVGDYPASLTQGNVVKNKMDNGTVVPEVKSMDILQPEILKKSGAGYIQMLDKNGKVLSAPLYRGGSAGKGFKQDEPGLDAVYGALPLTGNVAIKGKEGLDPILSYYNAYELVKKNKNKVYTLKTSQAVNKDIATYIKSVDYGIVLGNTWRYLTQDLNAKKEGDSWYSLHKDDATYTTSDNIALSLKIPDYYDNNKLDPIIGTWLEDRDKDAKQTDVIGRLKVRLYDADGKLLKNTDTEYVDADGYALNLELKSCGGEVNSKAEYGSYEWLQYCIAEGRSILTLPYDPGKKQSSAKLKTDSLSTGKNNTVKLNSKNEEYCSFTAVVVIEKKGADGKWYTISTVTDDKSDTLPDMIGSGSTMRGEKKADRKTVTHKVSDGKGGLKDEVVDADNRCNVVAINFSYKDDSVTPTPDTEVYVHYQVAELVDNAYRWKVDSKGEYTEVLTYHSEKAYEELDKSAFGKTYTLDTKSAAGDEMPELYFSKDDGRLYVALDDENPTSGYYVLYDNELSPQIRYLDAGGNRVNGSEYVDGGRINGIFNTSNGSYKYNTGAVTLNITESVNGKLVSTPTKITDGKITDALNKGRVDIYIPVFMKTDTPTWRVNVYYLVEDAQLHMTFKGNIPMGTGYSYDADDEIEYQGRSYYIDLGSYAEYLNDNETTYTSYPLSVYAENHRHSVNSPTQPGTVNIYIPYIRPVEDYVYHSEPEAFAEMKNADKQNDVKMDDTGRADPHYQELFEAMAGVPSTELLYFSVGGSEFLVEFRAELEKEVVERTYCSHFGGNECEFMYNDRLDGQSITNSGSTAKHSDTYVNVLKDGTKVVRDSTTAVNDSVNKVTYSTSTVTNEWYNIPGSTMTNYNMSVAAHDSNTVFKFIWEGNITNADTGSKPSDHKNAVGWKSGTDQDSRVDNDSNNAYVDNCTKATDSNAKQGDYGEPGAMGTEHNISTSGGGGFNWNVDAYNKALSDAVEWAKKMEAISDGDGQVIKLANSDGVTRSWHSGNATITIWFDDISVASKADEKKNKQADGTYKSYHSKNTGYSFTTAGYTTDLLLKAKDDERLGTTWREDYGEKAHRGASSGCYGSCYDLAQYNAQATKSKEYIKTWTVPELPHTGHQHGTPTEVKTSFTYRDPLTAAITGGRVCGKEPYKISPKEFTSADAPKYIDCTKEIHNHSGWGPDSCYGNLKCDKEEHSHDSSCYDKDGKLTCTKEPHTHGSSCYDTSKGAETCGKKIHNHNSADEEPCNDKWETPKTASHTVHVCTHTCGSWKALVETEAKAMPTVKYHIEITFEQPYTMSDGINEGAITTRDTLICPANTLPAHALCGPCCSHDLDPIEDTWTQRAEVWSVRLTDVNVMMLDEGYVTGMSEIRKGSDIPLDEADVLEALIIQGQPNIFYNIAASMNGMKKVKSTDGGYSGLVIKDGSVSGRLRYSLQTAQDDNVYWEELINGSAKRTNHCDGKAHTLSVYNPAPDGGAGHREAWATGMTYSHHAFRHWIDLHKRNTSNKYGYNDYYTDNLDRLTPEWEKFDARRNMDTSLTVISDFLILQTSSGDQSMMYYERTVNAKAQENFPAVKWNSSSEAWNAMVYGNPYCVKATALNRGGYNGLYNLVDYKYRGTGGNTKIATAFDNDKDEYGSLSTVDELISSGKYSKWSGKTGYRGNVTANSMYNNGNFMVTGTGKQTGDPLNGEASSASQANSTVGLVRTGSTSRKWHNSATVTRNYYRGNKDADMADASYDKLKKAKCSGDFTYEGYQTGAPADSSIYHSSSPCFGQLRLTRPVHNIRLTEVFTQYIENCNKEYIPGQSHAVWHPILDVSYARDKTAADDYQKKYVAEDITVVNPITGTTMLKLFGWQKDAIYAYGKTNVNNIVVHDPVSVEAAFVIGQSKSLDQRVLPEDRTAALNDALKQLGHCPGTADECEHSYLDCDYFKTAGAGKSMMSVPGIKVKTFNGKTWARVLYQNITSNENYFTAADAMSVNTPGKFSALGLLDSLSFESGKYEFLLDYPDSRGEFTGAYNEWSQSQNPFSMPAGAQGTNAPGYVGIHEDYWNSGYGKGIEKNMSVCVLDGAVNHSNWWMCVGIMNTYWASSSDPANGIYTMPGPVGPGTTGTLKTQGVSQCELWLRVDPSSSDGQIAVRSAAAGTHTATGANLCTSCHGECAWNSNKTCSACGNTGMGKCVICKGSGEYNGKECIGCNGTGRSFHTLACFTSETLHDAPTVDYYNGFTAAGGKSTNYAIPGIKVKEFDGKTWARVFYQDVSGNSGYVSNSTWLSSNSPILFSALGKLDQIKYGDGYDFILDYPDSYGPYAGAYHQWHQDVNPLSIAPSVDGKSVSGYIEYHNDFKSTTYGGGLQQGNGSCKLDGMVGSGYWWLAVGLTANYGNTSELKPYAMPGPNSDANGAQKVSQCELWVRVNPASYDGNIVVQDSIDWTGDRNDGSLVIKSEKNTHTLGNSCFTGNSAGYQIAYRNMLKGDYSDMHKMVGDELWNLIMSRYSLNSWHEHDESCYKSTVATNVYTKEDAGYGGSGDNYVARPGSPQKLNAGVNEIALQGTPDIGKQLTVHFNFAYCTGADTLSNLKVKTSAGYISMKQAQDQGYISNLSIISNEENGGTDYTAFNGVPVKAYDNLDGLLNGGSSSRGFYATLTVRFIPKKAITGIGVTLASKTLAGDGLRVTGESVTTKLICTTAERLSPGTHTCKICGGTGITADATSDMATGTEYLFSYTGGGQSITLPAGTYKLEAWGAQGGMYSSGNQGAQGAYAEGIYSFDTETTLYVYAGEKGSNYGSNKGSFNGGGTGRAGGGDGGGATDFRLTGGAWNLDASLRSRLLVAGGGGGSDLNSAGGAGGKTTGNGATNSQNGAANAGGGGQYYGGYSAGGSLGTFGVGGGELGYKQLRLTNAVTSEPEGCYSGLSQAYWYDTRTIVSGTGNPSGRVFTGILTPGHRYEFAFNSRYSSGNDGVIISYGNGAANAQTFNLTSNYERKSIRFTAGSSDLKIMTVKGPTHSSIASTFWITDMVLIDLDTAETAGAIDAGGGGGGYFGGASGYGGHAAGGGGSSYIKGYPGCSTDYVAYQGNARYISGTMKSGVNTGNGYAKITVISLNGHDTTCPECGGTGTITVAAPVDFSNLTTFIKNNISKVPLYVGDIVNPIWDCGLHADACTTHVCNSACGKVYTLSCTEPHHNGEHYASCMKPCLNDALHRSAVTSAVTGDGRAVELGNFILLDNYFDVYFANIGNFHETDDHGLYDTEVPKGMGYTSPMDTTKWTREKLIRFPYPVLYERFDGEWEEYRTYEWIELEVRDDNGKGISEYHFYAPLYGNEIAQGSVEYAVEAINTKWKVMDSDEAYWKDWKNYSFRNPGKYWLDKAYVRDNEYSNTNYDDCPLTGTVITNAQRHADLTAYHTVWKKNYIDLIGRIGNLLIDDTDDMRYSNLFKTSTAADKWYVEGLIHEVDPTDPYGYMSWHYNAGGLATDIRGLQLLEKPNAAYLDQLKAGTTESSPEYRNEYAAKKYVYYSYDYYNTYGKLKWTEESEGVYDQSTPIASSNNRDSELNKFDALQDNELKLGYGFIWDIQTIGSYHNGILDVKPYIYALNSETGELYPADIYMGSDTAGYEAVNIFGLEDMNKGTSQYQELADRLAKWYMYFEFTGSQRRRNITKEELENTVDASECVRTAVIDENGNPVTITVEMSGPQLIQSYDELGNEIWIIASSRESARPSPNGGGMANPGDALVETQLLREASVPTGDYFRLGTMQHMYATGRARTFIGSPSVYAAVIDKNLKNIDLTTFDDKRYEYGRTSPQAQEGMVRAENPDANTNLLGTPDAYYGAHGQRWHLTSKLPSSAVVVLNRDGSHHKPTDKIMLNGTEIYAMDEIKNIDGKWLLLITADITCDGEVFSLHYSQGLNNGVITSKGNTYTFADGNAVNAVQTGNSFTVPTLLAVYEALENDEVDYQIMQTH